MAPLPQNNTGRVFVDYAGAFGSRSMQFRFEDAVAAPDALANVIEFVEALANSVWYAAVQVTGYRLQAKNGLISFPASGPLYQGTQAGNQAILDYPFFVSAVGRDSVAGRRTRLSIYGTNIIRTADYRIDTENVPQVTAVLAALRSLSGAGCFASVAGFQVTIPEYMNTGYNSYYQRKARRA